MIRISSPRHLLLGAAVACALGFGGLQALAEPAVARASSCEMTGQAYLPINGCPECPGGGYCDGWNTDCVCFGGEG